MQHALGVDGSYAWFAKTWANCTWWQCFPKLKASTQGGYIHRSKKDIHTACFRCKGQPWRVCMHNRNWETRALWQFIVSADDYFKALAISVSQAASQVWYTKADSYAPCFWTSDQSSGWFASTNVILASESKIPWTADVPCRLGYVFSLSLFCRDTSKAETHAACFGRWWQLCMICKELSELYFVTVFSQFEGVHVQRSQEDIHTACFRCKGQPWRVCMHNRNWESRALWQYIVSAEDCSRH